MVSNGRRNLICCVAACFFWVVCAAGSSSGQSPEGQSALIKTDKGILLVSNEPGNFYTMEIKGRSIEPGPEPLWFKVDGRFLQIQTALKSQFLNGKVDGRLDDKALLTSHRDWEADYASTLFKAKLKVDSEWIKLSSGKDALGWSYDMPTQFVADRPDAARKQFFLVVVKGDGVLLVNSALVGNDTEKDMKRFLFDTLDTLKPSDKPISISKTSEAIRKGK